MGQHSEHETIRNTKLNRHPLTPRGEYNRMKREDGYYWVKHDHFSWVVAYYRTDGKWSFERRVLGGRAVG